MKKAMISYSHDNSAFVEELDFKLASAGIDAWIDKRDIAPGFSWRQAIFDAVINCEYTILCLSPSYLSSQMCRMESYLARCYKRKILPLMIEQCWGMLGKHHEMRGIEDLFALDFDTNSCFGLPVHIETQYEQLINTVKGLSVPHTIAQAYISYRISDGGYATQVADDLQNQGISAWIATRSYRLGDQWLDRQWEALMNANVLIVILSPEVPQSLMIHNEVLIARTRNIPILPVLVNRDSDSAALTKEISRKLNDSFEMRLLSEINWFYIDRPDYKSMIGRLADAVRMSVPKA